MKNVAKILVMVALVVMISASTAHATQVVFQVNMINQIAMGTFNPASDTIEVRGAFNNWDDDSLMLTQLNDSVWADTFEIAPGDYEYKFRVPRGDHWESIANRTLTVQASGLQVLPLAYFDNVAVLQYTDVEVLFRVDMNVQILRGSFDAATDWVVVRGNHPNLGNWGGAVARLTEETTNPGIYSAWIQFDSILVGAALPYKFVIIHDGDPNDGTGWEAIADNRSFTPTGTEPDDDANGYGEIMPETPFFSNTGFEDIISEDLYVTFQVDLRPMWGRLRDTGILGVDAQTNDSIFPPLLNINLAGFFNGWPWGGFDPQFNMNDAGQNGDLVANDTVWSITHLFPAGTERELQYKFGINEFDAEARVAANHVAHLNNDADSLRVDVVCFGELGDEYDPWQGECQATDVPAPHEGGTPSTYMLWQNYPNPFNPSTTITFALPRQDMMTLRVFDLLGREVLARDLGRMEAGTHTVAFDGTKLSTGVYFYRLESPNFTATRKMLLMK